MPKVDLEQGCVDVLHRGWSSQPRNLAIAVGGIGFPLLYARIVTAQGPPFQPPTQPPMGPFGGRGWGPWGISGTGDWVSWVVTLLVVFLLVAAAVYLALRLIERWHRPPAPREIRALEILKERYARGEIDREEFEEKRSDLL